MADVILTQSQVKAVNSQLARINDIASTPQSQMVLGDTIGNSTGGTVDYTTVLNDVVSDLNSWANRLLTLNNNVPVSLYINGDNLNVNEYNHFYNNLSTDDKNLNFSTYSLINQNYSIIKNIRNDYFNLFNQLYIIGQTGIDDNIIIQQDYIFTNFQIVVNLINQFYNSVILNIQNTDTNTITSSLTVISKYIRDNIDLMDYVV